MPSSHFDCIHNSMMSGVACHQSHWKINMVKRWRAWLAITALGQHARSDDVGRGMSSSPLDRTHSFTTLGMACHHGPWKRDTVRRRQARLDDVGHGVPSSLLDCTERRTCKMWHKIIAFEKHTRGDDVKCAIQSRPLLNTQGQTISGVECHPRL